ncbi:uncharacterized protein METZ01_LOCUS378520, partial [marine metagenome]
TNPAGETAEEKVVVKITDVNDAPTLTFDGTKLQTSDTSLPVKLTNIVGNGDGTYTADIEVNPSFASFEALAGFTFWFSFDETKMTFSEDDIAITAGGSFEQVSLSADGSIKVLSLHSGTNTLEAGKIGTITFTATAGSGDLPITIEAQLTGGDKDSIDAVNSSVDTTVYQFTLVRTDVDYESPVDADANNVYNVTVQASDGVNPTTQDIQVTVTDDPETGRTVSSTFAEGINDADIDDDNASDGNVLDNGTGFINFSLWATEFDINSITLPETVMDEMVSESFDLSNLNGLLGFQTDS